MSNLSTFRSGKSSGIENGFTLIELIIIIVTLGILAAVAIPKLGSMTESSRLNATKDEMRLIKKAIIGDAGLISGGQYVDRGFEGDVGFAPSNLADLVIKPDSISAYDKFTRLGWNGPYLDSAGQHYLADAWDSAYAYNSGARTLTSVGADPDIAVTF
jgi:type II secretory pathway pseudopilin PulG